jgi:hypothetical protein
VKKKIGLLLMVIVLVVSLSISLGLISASAAAGILPQTNQAAIAVDQVPYTMKILDFEGFQDMYYPTGIFEYYPGIMFLNVRILDKGMFGYDYSGFPPHSGNAVLAPLENSPVDIVFDFPVSYVEGWFTFESTGYMEAYDVLGNLIAKDSCEPCYGFNAKMFVKGAGIREVQIHDSFSTWIVDDIAYEVEPEPVPSVLQWGVVVLVSLFSGAIVWVMRRRLIRSKIH